MVMLCCRACGKTGTAAAADESFENRGRHGLVQVRKCLRCGAGIFVRFTLLPTRAEAELIPAEAWEEMERVREACEPAQSGTPAAESQEE